jgi:ankyrin repeat protein
MSSSFGLSSLEDENLIISAVRNGNLISLEVYLNEHNDRIINKLYNFDNNNLSILMGCCYYKYVNLVRMLLKRRSCLSIDLLGTIIFDSSYIHPEIATGVPALWIATAMNHFEIVKLLVEIGGANINHVTESHSTAFRVACFNGNLELCKYLVKHGANYKQSRKGNYTNIMVSAYWKHEHIIHYLIDELNCDPNEQSEHGRTALHNSIESESIEITKYLLEKGVPLTRDTQTNLTPLLLAAKNLKFNLMNLFENFCSKIEWIEAMELVAAVYASQESDNYNLNKAYQYLNEALSLRLKYYLPKTLSEDCHEIFGSEQECQTIDELEKLEENSNRFHIESLLIFERILGLNHDDYYYSLRYYGASLIDSNHFYKGLQIWIYQLNLSEKYLIHHDNTQLLRTFVQVFFKIQQNKQINYEFGRNLYKIIFIIYQLIKNKDQYTDFNIHTLLYLITILATVCRSYISYYLL